jgi:hypothetical protein
MTKSYDDMCLFFHSPRSIAKPMWMILRYSSRSVCMYVWCIFFISASSIVNSEFARTLVETLYSGTPVLFNYVVTANEVTDRSD